MAKNAHGSSGRTIRGVNISYDLLEAIRELDHPEFSEINSCVKYSKSTVHSHLATLEENEMVVHKEEGYRLGLRFLDFARQVHDQIGNYDIIKNELDSTAEKTGEVVQFGLEEHGRVKYLYKASGEQGVITASRPGRHSPMHSTSLGKAMLAFLPEERVESILRDRGLHEQTANTITDRSELQDTLVEIRECGYALDDEENLNGLRCVAAPVRGGDTVTGAVSITGPTRRFTYDRLENELANIVQETADVIELNTKYS